jgi:transposase
MIVKHRKVFERWVKKYRESGEDALKENGGTAKFPNKGGSKKSYVFTRRAYRIS